jgi:hypothetical protein
VKLQALRNGCVRLLLACGLASLLVACSGAVSGPPPVPGPISVAPSTAILYSQQPTTFVLSGGTAPYFVTSSDQATVPVIGSVAGTSFAVVPRHVAAETPVTLTVTDAAGSAPVAVSLTVRPSIVSNVVTITPTSTECGTAVCPGGDAEVKVVLMQNGVPLSGRQVLFRVVSGPASVLPGSFGGQPGLAVTDATGTARVVVRVSSDATTQSALLEITDVSSESRLLTSVAISIANAPLNAQPNTINFVGTTATTCAASGVSATVIVFGGRPPYSISQPSNFTIFAPDGTRVITSSGGSFTIRPTGVCVASETAAIVDGNGSTVTVTVSNVVGSAPPPTPIQVTPNEVTLDSCNSVATVTLVGGTPTSYQFNVQSGAVTVTAIPNNQFTLQRRSPSDPALSPIQVGFTDGQSVTEVTVNLGPVAEGPCPTP